MTDYDYTCRNCGSYAGTDLGSCTSCTPSDYLNAKRKYSEARINMAKEFDNLMYFDKQHFIAVNTQSLKDELEALRLKYNIND